MRIRQTSALVLASVLIASPAQAALKNFNKLFGGPYHDPANWTPNGVPLSNDDLSFNLNGGYTVTFSASAAAQTLLVASDGVNLSLNTFTLTLSPPTQNVPAIQVQGDADGRGFLGIANGTVDLDNSGGDVVVGSQSFATSLEMQSGGTLFTDDLTLGTGSAASTMVMFPGSRIFSSDVYLGGNANVTVFGAGTTWNNGIGRFNLGTTAGPAQMRMNTGASLSSDYFNVGTHAGSTANFDLSGANTVLNLTGFLTVGSSGSGTMTVTDTPITSTLGTIIGHNIDGNGKLIMRGQAQLNTGYLYVGFVGDGELLIETGADVTTPAGAVTDLLGWGAASTEILTIRNSGSSFSTPKVFAVGDFGTGILNIEQVGSANVGTLNLANSGDSTGTVNVRTNGTLTTGSVNIGNGGKAGHLNIETSAAMTSTSVRIGNAIQSIGVANVSGPLSTWSMSSLDIGSNGIGTLNIHEGGSVSNTGSSTIGSNGRLNLLGGSFSTSTLGVISGGILNFESGQMTFTGAGNALTVGTSGPFGSLLRLGRSQRVTVVNSATINGGARVVLEGGEFLVNGALTNSGELLLADSTSSLGGGTLSNNGFVSGSGRITSLLANSATGEVRVSAGQRLLFSGSSAGNSGRLSLVDGQLDFAGTLTNNSTGVISGRGLLRAASIANAGQIQLSAGISDIFGPVTQGSGGRIIVTGGASATFYNPVTINAGEFRVSQNSTATFLASVTGSNFFTGPGAVNFEAGASMLGALMMPLGSATVGATAQVGAGPVIVDRLLVEGDLSIAANSPVSRVGQLSIPTGKLDLANNDLIVDGGDVAEISGYIASGRLTSSSANAITTLGVILNGSRYTTFSGQSVSPDDVLVKYTYFGDTNLDGRVSIADYLALDRGFARASTGWANGDFDHSGVIDAVDFFAIDQAFLGQGAPLTAMTLSMAVPEPGIGLAVAALGCLGLGRGRRRIALREERWDIGTSGRSF